MKREAKNNIIIIILVIIVSTLIQLTPAIIVQIQTGFEILGLDYLAFISGGIIVLAVFFLAIVFSFKYLVFKRIMRKGNTEEKQ